jgi:uncharacterized protein (DUF2225 family)
MTWPALKEFNCPLCSKVVKAYAVVTTNTFGGGDSEMRSYAVGFDSLRFSLYTCGSCGYTDYFYNLYKPLTDEQVKRIRKYLDTVPLGTISHLSGYAPYVQGEERYALSKHKLLINILKIREAESVDIAKACLEGAWIADDVADEENEHLKRELREEALKYFERALKNREVQDKSETASIIYLVGELYRRLGKFNRAIDYLSMVRHGENWLKEIARKQIQRAKKKDSSLIKFK